MLFTEPKGKDAISISQAKGPRTDGTRAAAAKALEILDAMLAVLGLLQGAREEGFPAEVVELVEKRQQARKEKDFAEADRIREELKAMSILLEDTPQGVKIKKM